jgi:hypothetical protein
MSTVHLVFFIYNSLKICSYHSIQIDYGEGIILGNVWRLLEFKTIYPNIRTEPILGVYPPIYQLLSAGVAVIVGLNLASGRIVSLLSAFVTAYIIYKMVPVEDKSLRFSLPALFLSSPIVMTWGPLMRVDSLAVLFNISGLYIFTRFKGKNKLILTSTMFALSALTKQNMFAGILSIILFLSIKKRWRELLVLVSYYLTVFFSITMSLFFLTGSEYFAHIYLYHWGHPFELSRLLILVSFFELHSLMLIGVMGATLLCKKKDCMTLFCIYLLTTLLLCLLILKSGAATNYFIEPVAALVIFLAASCSQLKRYSMSIIFITFITIIQFTVYAHHISLIPSLEENRVFIDQMNLLRYLGGINENVLCEYSVPCVISGKGPAIDWFLLSRIFQNNLWNERDFMNIILQRKFSLLVLSFNITSNNNFLVYNNERFTYNLILNFKENYIFKENIGSYYIYTINQSRIN